MPEAEVVSPAEFVQRIHRYTPRIWVTPTLVGLNIAVYLAMGATGVSFMNPTPQQLVLWGGNAGVLSIGDGQIWRMFTSMFVHIGLIHIGMNMWVLWSIGRFIERLVGNSGFLAFYLVAGLCGSLASALYHPRVVSAGASGAIFGLIGLLLGFLLRHRRTIPAPILASLRKTGGAFVLYNLLFSAAIPGIDLSAHLGGLAGGFVLGLVAVAPLTEEGARSRIWRAIAAGLLGAGIVVAGAAISRRALLFALALLCSAAAMAQTPVETLISRIEQPQNPNRQGLDALTLEQVMEKFHVRGLSIAVVHDFQVQWAKGYGVADVATGRPVDVHTLFQACSISKPVTAFGVLRLVQQGQINLDEDINHYLKSWHVDNVGPAPVTPRSLMSHTSGSDDGFGFPGYDPSAPLPTPVQVLNGQSPSTIGPVRFTRPPYQSFKYSGGGVLVMQVMVMDQTQRPFDEFMQGTVLQPLGMTDSTYQQPLPPERRGQAAAAHSRAGTRMGPPWHVYPEQAAAGLWTTPSDLARFVIGVQTALRGDSAAVLNRVTVEQMITPVSVGPFGVGLMIDRRGEGWYFMHSGDNWGFTCDMMGHVRKGYGVVVMTNSEVGGKVIAEVEARVAAAYNWDTLDKPLIR